MPPPATNIWKGVSVKKSCAPSSDGAWGVTPIRELLHRGGSKFRAHKNSKKKLLVEKGGAIETKITYVRATHKSFHRTGRIFDGTPFLEKVAVGDVYA